MANPHTLHSALQYPYNNLLHHHVENIIVSCLEVKRNQLTDHILNDCGLVGKVLAAEKGPSLPVESNVPTLPSEEKEPPRILCTEEDSASHEPETSERLVDAQEGQTGGAAEASSTKGAANEPCSSLKMCATLC
ncbi:unnamed protein product [Miscanthus lutarioriparius]|uniref:Uncharacterized protein n=1 Tax=Miscanthus lutarioriparius TaxID=422564 RepID=A0A811NZ01_9POAL|nr:unnamed protein product [Miscanthus lutarioriparius]